MERQVNFLVKEIKTLKEAAVNNQQSNVFPALPVPQGQISTRLEDISRRNRVTGGLEADSRSTEDFNSRIVELCESGRRVMGFSPIEPRMLEMQIRSFGAKNQEEAMLMV